MAFKAGYLNSPGSVSTDTFFSPPPHSHTSVYRCPRVTKAEQMNSTSLQEIWWVGRGDLFHSVTQKIYTHKPHYNASDAHTPSNHCLCWLKRALCREFFKKPYCVLVRDKVWVVFLSSPILMMAFLFILRVAPLVCQSIAISDSCNIHTYCKG